MRQYFSWQPEVRAAVRRHVEQAIKRLDPSRYRQETAYVNALMGKLDGVAYDGPYGRVEFLSTIVDDHGPGAAESEWGADFAITAHLSQNGRTSTKAILGQAKRGIVSWLYQSRRKKLNDQIRGMKRATSAPKVLEVPTETSGGPTVCSGNAILSGKPYERWALADYIVRRIMTCIEGDTRPDFVEAVSESSLSKLHLIARSQPWDSSLFV